MPLSPSNIWISSIWFSRHTRLTVQHQGRQCGIRWHLLSTCSVPEISEIYQYSIYSAVDNAHILWREIKQGREMGSTGVPFNEEESGKASLIRGLLSNARWVVSLYTDLSCYHESGVSCFTKGQPLPFLLSSSEILVPVTPSLSYKIHRFLFSGILLPDTNMF